MSNNIVRKCLSQLYADNIDQVLGMGNQLMKTTGPACEGLVLGIKSLTIPVRIKYLDIVCELNMEKGRIEAIKDMRDKFQQQSFALLVALSVGIANFLGRFLYHVFIDSSSSSGSS